MDERSKSEAGKKPGPARPAPKVVDDLVKEFRARREQMKAPEFKSDRSGKAVRE